MKSILFIAIIGTGFLLLIPSLPIARAAAFPVISGTASTDSTVSSSTGVVNLPSVASPGDLLIACIDSSAAAITWPTGWADIFTPSAPSTQLACRYKFAVTGDGATISVTFSVSLVFSSVSYWVRDASTTIGPQAVNPASTGTSANPAPPALTVTPSADRLFVVIYGWGGTSTNSAYPAGYTLGQKTQIGTGTNRNLAIAAKEVNGSSDTPGTATLSGSQTWSAVTLSIAPAAAASSSSSVITNALDTNAWIFMFLFLAYGALLFVGWYQDSALWLIPAGIVMFFLAFQGWNVTSSFLVVAALVTLGLATIVTPMRVVIQEALG